jgi:hypothetical protein
VTESGYALRPAEFCRLALNTIEASEGRRRRRKRNTTPDAIGLAMQRDLLERAIGDDPAPEDFEAWLLDQALRAPASGPVRAVCIQILDEYRFAAQDVNFGHWLDQGAPSDDARPTSPGQDDQVERHARQREATQQQS